MAVIEGDVQINLPAWSLKTHHQRFAIWTAGISCFVGVDARWKNFKAVTLVVEQRHCVAHNDVGQLTEGFARQLLGGFDFSPGQNLCHAESCLRFKIEDDAAFD